MSNAVLDVIGEKLEQALSDFPYLKGRDQFEYEKIIEAQCDIKRALKKLQKMYDLEEE